MTMKVKVSTKLSNAWENKENCLHVRKISSISNS